MNFLSLPRNNVIQAEYIWIDLNNNLRSKSKTLPIKSYKPGTLPIWDFDGSSTGQAPVSNSEVILNPQAIFKDPFRQDEKNPNLLVLCDCYYPNMKAHKTNTRYPAVQIFNKHRVEDSWFGLEQEFFVLNKDGSLYGNLEEKELKMNTFYCSVGTGNVFLRDLLETLYRACLYAGIKVSGVNLEHSCCQMEYQVGPVTGINAGDQLWVSRYILQRIAERFDVKISFDPKPFDKLDGSGCHCNFSTKKMREEKGYEIVLSAIKKLETNHLKHIKKYGDNKKRLTGKDETSHLKKFSSGVGDRSKSVRIPRCTERDGCGYLEDRRPASNSDPYIVTSMILESCCDD